MGCDIYQRTFIYPKYQKRHVDYHEIFDMNEDMYFKPLITERNYDLFGCIAGVRGNRYQIFCKHGGIPRFCTKTFKEYCHDSQFHSYTWFYVPELIDELTKVINLLKKNKDKYIDLKKKYPNKWYDHWCDDIDPDSLYYDNDEYVWLDNTDDYLLKRLETLLFDVKKYYVIPDDDDIYGNYVDWRKTIILFYFDS